MCTNSLTGSSPSTAFGSRMYHDRAHNFDGSFLVLTQKEDARSATLGDN